MKHFFQPHADFFCYAPGSNVIRRHVCADSSQIQRIEAVVHTSLRGLHCITMLPIRMENDVSEVVFQFSIDFCSDNSAIADECVVWLQDPRQSTEAILLIVLDVPADPVLCRLQRKWRWPEAHRGRV